MIYIIEGIDRVGKTTLANKVAKYYNCDIFKDKYSKYLSYSDNNVGYKFSVIYNFLSIIDRAGIDLVVDRLHLTEEVYNFYRGQNFKYYNYYDLLFSRLNTKLILVKPDNIEKSSKEHGCNLANYNDRFFELFIYTKIENKVVINQKDIFDENLEEVLE